MNIVNYAESQLEGFETTKFNKSSPKSWCKLPFGICMIQVTTRRWAARSANACFLATSLSSK